MGAEASKVDEGFKEFVKAEDFREARDLSSQFHKSFNLDPNNHKQSLKKIQQLFHSKKKSPWDLLEKRALQSVYKNGEVCKDTKVLVIGCGPCGLRMAIEAALLGAKVRMVDAKDTFDRHNVLFLWPFVIQDLKKLGARVFYPDFCRGKDHISIRRLQLILLKIALLLGVEIAAPVTFKGLEEPGDERRWRARLSPPDHTWNDYEFDVIIGATGKGNVLPDFKNKWRYRNKQTIMITANFKKYPTDEENALEEMGARFYVYDKEFFDELRKKTGLQLESFVYYKDETHSFVMTAKRDSLIREKVLKMRTESKDLLKPSNIDRKKLLACMRKVVSTATNKEIPILDFVRHKNLEEDVAVTDCTAAFHADNACMVKERLGCRLLQMVVGDRLMEPYWPTGAGCARGFLSVLDAAWLLNRWGQGAASPLEVIAERETIYQLLSQTTPDSLKHDINHYTIDPVTRYGAWVKTLTVQPNDVRHLYDTDHPIALDEMLDKKTESPKPTTLKKAEGSDAKELLSWYQKQLKPYKNKVKVTNLTSSWSNGIALCAALHSVDHDIVDVESLSSDASVENLAKAFTIIQTEFNIRPLMTAKEIASGQNLDKVDMFAFLGHLRLALMNYEQGPGPQDLSAYSGNAGHHLYDSLAFVGMLSTVGFTPPTRSITPKGSRMQSLDAQYSNTGTNTGIEAGSEDISSTTSPAGGENGVGRPLPAPPKPPRLHLTDEPTAGILMESHSKPKPKSAPAPQQEEEEQEEYRGSLASTAALPADGERPSDPHPSLALLKQRGAVKTQLKALRFEDAENTAHVGRPKLQVSQFGPALDVERLGSRMKELQEMGPNRMATETCCLCGKKMLDEERRQLFEDPVSGRAFSFHRECFRCRTCNSMLRYGNVLPHKDQTGKISFYCFRHAPQKKKLKRYKSSSLQGEGTREHSPATIDEGFGPTSLALYLRENLELKTNVEEDDEGKTEGKSGNEDTKLSGTPDQPEDEEEEYGDLNDSVVQNQTFASLKSVHMLVAHELQLNLDAVEEMEEEGVADRSSTNESMFQVPSDKDISKDVKSQLGKRIDDLQKSISCLHNRLESNSDTDKMQKLLEDLENRIKLYEESAGIILAR